MLPELISNPDVLTKAKYLQDLGVESTIREDEYDLSQMKPSKNSFYKKQREVEPIASDEEVEEEDTCI